MPPFLPPNRYSDKQIQYLSVVIARIPTISATLESPLGYDMYPLYWTTSKGGIFMRYSYEFKRKI
nr:MAG TPA: hypothetical protein [Caudoviricetes sp.]